MIPIIETIPLQQLASGDYLSLQLYKFVGSQPGRKVYIQSNLHGGELAGNVVAHRLMEWLMTLDSSHLIGELWFVPVCNPVGVNVRSHHYASGRFDFYSGHNWNRIFWDYTKEVPDLMQFAKSQLVSDRLTIQQNFRQRVQEQFVQLKSEILSEAGVPFHEKYRYLLQSLCLDANYVLDLHTSSDRGITYVYYFRNREQSAALFLLEASILLDRYDGDAFDEAFMKPWLALEQAFAELGHTIQFDIEAYTLELGAGMQIDSQAVEQGILGIQNYLMMKGILNLPNFSHPDHDATRFTCHSKARRYFAPGGGIVQTRVPLGTAVQEGDILYELLNFNKEGQIPTIRSVRAGRSGLVFDVAMSQVVSEGEYVLGILED